MQRKKPKAQRKEDVIRVRVSASEKRTLIAGAQRAGLEVSSWLRMLGLREAGSSPGAKAPR